MGGGAASVVVVVVQSVSAAQRNDLVFVHPGCLEPVLKKYGRQAGMHYRRGGAWWLRSVGRMVP